MSSIDFDRIATVLKTISTERRLRILRVLLDSKGPMPTTNIAAATGLTEPQTSFNLTAMRVLGIVLRQMTGRWSFYEVNRGLFEDVARFLTEKGLDDGTGSDGTTS